MAVDRTLAADLVGRILALYGDIETRLAAGIAVRLASGMDAPEWAADKLAGAASMRRWAQALLVRLDGPMRSEVAQALVLAYCRGGDAALAEIMRLQSTHPEWLRAAQIASPNARLREAIAARGAQLGTELWRVERTLPGSTALMRMIFSLTTRLSGTHTRILRWADDAYRTVIAETAAPGQLAGIDTRRLASQRAWNKLLDQGITGFQDTRGRSWNLASYVEMATRTTVAQASVEGHLDRMGSAGLDLVIVSDAPQECARCRDWEGKVLTRAGGGSRVVTVPDPLRADGTVAVEVAGSVDDAIRGGLMHPNCRHSINAYLPGVTRVPRDTADPAGDAARQRLRALERRVRRLKIKQAGALTPDAARAAGRQIRAVQSEIRTHVAATGHLGIRRKRERERIDLGNVRT